MNPLRRPTGWSPTLSGMCDDGFLSRDLLDFGYLLEAQGSGPEICAEGFVEDVIEPVRFVVHEVH